MTLALKFATIVTADGTYGSKRNDAVAFSSCRGGGTDHTVGVISHPAPALQGGRARPSDEREHGSRFRLLGHGRRHLERGYGGAVLGVLT